MPSMRDVSLRQLRVVAAIAKAGRILTAADKLGVTPPAVTLQLRQLEESIGMA
jgi:LysR family transcriptional regulator, low CO2-responsive transcriptional regulator